MNESDVPPLKSECNGNCPPLEFHLINGSLSQSRQCCHLPRGSNSTLQSTLQRCSSLASNFSPGHDTISSMPASSGIYNSQNNRLPEEDKYSHRSYPLAPPRTTSLIQSLIDKGHKGGQPKMTRSHTASPAGTWTGSGQRSSGSFRAEKVLPLDSRFCNRIQKQTSIDGNSSSTSTLAPSDTV